MLVLFSSSILWEHICNLNARLGGGTDQQNVIMILFSPCTFVCSPGSVKAEVLIKIKNSSSEAVKKAIDEEVKESHVGRVAVDRYRYSLESAKGWCLS